MKRNQKRKRIQRFRKPVMLVMGEGNYTTERIYLSHFTGNEYSYCLKFRNSGGFTDPAHIFRELEKAFQEVIGDTAEERDCAYALVDLDCSKEKAVTIKALTNQSDRCGIIVSNPCFEVWLIDHFTTKCPQYPSSQHVKKALKQQYLRGIVTDYKESTDIYSLIADKLDFAIANEEERQKRYKNDDSWPNPDHNPRTDMVYLIKKLTQSQ